MIFLKHASLHREDLETCLPFRHEIAMMTGLPHVLLRTEWEIDGLTAFGLACENLPPE